MPHRASAVASEASETAPTQRDRHLQCIAERGRMGWQRASGYNWRVLVEADVSQPMVTSPRSFGRGNSSTWAFDDATFERSAAAFDNPDFLSDTATWV